MNKVALIILNLFTVVSILRAQEMNDFIIWESLTNKPSTIDDIVKRSESYDIILFGEEHDDSIAHALQLSILKALYAKYNDQLVLSMEMFDRDVQVVMDQYLNDYIQEKHFKKDARVWSNFSDYNPLVLFSKEQGIYIKCANAATRYTNLVGRKGSNVLNELSKESRSHYAPLPYELASGAYKEKLLGFMNGHSTSANADPENMILPVDVSAPSGPFSFDFIAGQSLWDATMAYSIAEVFSMKGRRKAKVFHLNGRFHSDEYFGIYTQLTNKYAKKRQTLTISAMGNDSIDNIDPSQFLHMADYLIFTKKISKQKQ